MQFGRKGGGGDLGPLVIDVKEDESGIERGKHKVRFDKLENLDMVVIATE